MTGDNIRANLEAERARARDCIEAAEHLLNGGFFNDSVSRAYYAAMHMARALLITKGLEAKTHRGVAQLLSLHFVKTGIVAHNVAADLAQLETFRELSDYHAATVVTADEARSEVARARSVMAACESALGR